MSNSREIIFNIIEVELKKAIDEVKNINASISYEKILLVFFDCLLTVFMEKRTEFVSKQSGNDYSRFKHARQFYHLRMDKKKCTKVFSDKLPAKELKVAIKFLLPLSECLIKERDLEIEEFGYLFEVFINKDNLSEGSTELVDNINRKDEGMFFSDTRIADFISNQIVIDIARKGKMDFSIIDPSMGGGAFVFSFLSNLQKKVDETQLKQYIENSVYGIDKNEYVVDYFLAFMILKYLHLDIKFDLVRQHFITADSLLLCVDREKNEWSILFPEVFKNGGFDYIIGNPPWGKIKANIREYNLLHDDITDAFQGDSLKREIEKNTVYTKDWETYKKYISDYSKRLKNFVGYKYQKYEVNGNMTGGDSDLYKFFIEQSYNVLKKDGMIGYIVPAAFYMSESATGLRHLLLEHGNIKYLLNFENKKKIFPIHPSYKFVILIYQRTEKVGKIEKAAFNLTEISDLRRDSIRNVPMISYTRQFLKVCSGDYWTVPECSSIFEQQLLKKLYSQYPMLKENRKNLWQVSFNREMDMTADSNKFYEKNVVRGKRLVPVYEGRMVNQYDSSQKIYVSGTGRKAVWKPNTEKGKIVSHYYVESENNCYPYYRACYCDITGQKNVRTILSSLVIPDAICGNKVPTCEFYPRNSIFYHLLWIGLSNSFVIDWIMRKKITITLNFYHWSQIPFPRLSSEDENGRVIAAAAAIILEKINAYDLENVILSEESEEFARLYRERKEKSIELLRLEIDIIVAQLYKLSLEELSVIMIDFPAIDATKEGITGDTRIGTDRLTSFVTRDTLLYKYAQESGVDDFDLKKMYEKHGQDILNTIGEISGMNERMHFYKVHNIVPY